MGVRVRLREVSSYETGGGGRILPAATLDVNDFFSIKANATKLGDFF